MKTINTISEALEALQTKRKFLENMIHICESRAVEKLERIDNKHNLLKEINRCLGDLMKHKDGWHFHPFKQDDVTVIRPEDGPDSSDFETKFAVEPFNGDMIYALHTIAENTIDRLQMMESLCYKFCHTVAIGESFLMSMIVGWTCEMMDRESRSAQDRLLELVKDK